MVFSTKSPQNDIDFQYIIAGGGAAGLLLAYRMAKDPFFDDKKILIIEKAKKTTNDRTWCFWEAPGGELDHLLFKTWNKATFKSKKMSRAFSLHPFRYKMIRSKTFYDAMHREIAKKNNISLLIDEVISIEDKGNGVQLKTVKQTYRCQQAFSSIYDPALLYKQHKYPVLQQHFLGWFIKTNTAVFNHQSITFMDFTIPQQGNTRFMYVLPLSKTEALIEYTLFSKDLLSAEAYENAIKTYIANLGISQYTIVEKEQGSIPMSCYNFTQYNTKNILYTGTAGGWTKPSTGYTFLNTVKKTKALIPFLKTGRPLSKFQKKIRFWYYDLLLLDVLHSRNHLGASIFSAIFKRNPPKRIFKFLDQQTTFSQELRILFSIKPYPFIKSLLRRIFK